MKYTVEFKFLKSLISEKMLRICCMRNNWDKRFDAKVCRNSKFYNTSYIYVDNINFAHIMCQELSDDPANSDYIYEVKEINE